MILGKAFDAKSQNVNHWEAEIDQIVARLYDLITDDLALITGGHSNHASQRHLP
ncbi:MAG: hypothetical protein AAGE59_22465 [Cyanobacteria bacterium P01_F01_bin.86]